MEVMNCRSCKRLFNYINGPRLCPMCRDELEKKFQEVKKHVEENPGITIAKLAEDMEVPVKQIKDWVREERLILSEAWGEILCDSCGKAIKSGRYCDECKRKMVTNLGSAYAKKKEEPKTSKSTKGSADGRMRFLD